MTALRKPLSPHLQVYRLQITSLLSITHRITGVFLTLGLLFLVYWLLSLAYGAEAYTTAQNFAGSFPGRIVLLAFSFSLFFHLLNGIRHLFWDAGYGFELEQVNFSGWLVIIMTVVLTVVVWFIGYQVRG